MQEAQTTLMHIALDFISKGKKQCISTNQYTEHRTVPGISLISKGSPENTDTSVRQAHEALLIDVST